jgi:hypothetical protein
MRPEAVSAPILVGEPEAVPSAVGETGVVTTETELQVFEYVRMRLPFLIAGDEELYTRLVHVRPVDHKTVFCVFYKQERKGRLFNFREGRGPRFRFEFAGEGANALETDSLSDIDPQLVAIYRQRVSELG